MTFDGPVEEYLHEAAMMGHNRPPKDVLTAEDRLAKIFQVAMSGRGSAVEALVEITAIAGMSAQNLFSATIEEWCRITRTKNKKNARTYRDSLLRKGWAEVEGEGRRKTFQSGYTEDQITAAVEMMRGEVLTSTGGEVLSSTPKEGLESTPTGTDEYPSEVLESTPQEVPESTPASRARVSYTGDNNNLGGRVCADPRARAAARHLARGGIDPQGFPYWINANDDLQISDDERTRLKTKEGVDDKWIERFLMKAEGFVKDADRENPQKTSKVVGRQLSFCLDDRDKEIEKQRRLDEKYGNKPKRGKASKEALELLRKQKERGER